MKLGKITGLLLLMSAQLSWASWQLSVNDTHCEISQTVHLANAASNYNVQIQFTVDSTDTLAFSAAGDAGALSYLTIADNEILSGTNTGFALQHSDARDLFIMLRDFAAYRKRPIVVSANVDDAGTEVTGYIAAEDILDPFKKHSSCFNHLAAAMQRL